MRARQLKYESAAWQLGRVKAVVSDVEASAAVEWGEERVEQQPRTGASGSLMVDGCAI